MLLFYLISFSSWLVLANCETLLDLGGTWKLSDAEGLHSDLNAVVPGGIFTDLMTNNVIDNIQYGSNDSVIKWVGRTNWTYSREFNVSANLLNKANVHLVFEGLDTHATIVLNGVAIGQSQNMFVRYIFDVKPQLKSTDNKLSVNFMAPVNISEELVKKQDYEMRPACPADSYNGECNVNRIRKMQSSFSWDWGPAFPSVGIWKDIYLEGYDSTAIRYVTVNTFNDTENWYMNVKGYFAHSKNDNISGTLEVSLSNNVTALEFVEICFGCLEVMEKTFTVPKNEVKLWWPNGYGDQNLYELQVNFTTIQEKTSKVLNVGFRSVELIEDNLEKGLTFYFKVNGVPMFSKGSNSIPVDILPEKGQDKTAIRNLLMNAKLANFNMLRVWGGGVYESDYFYETADKLGILLWQDCAFASALYPSYDEYLQNVAQEIEHNVKRLESHPSLFLWAGNNENEGNLRSWKGNDDDYEIFKNDYLKLYIDTIKTNILKLSNKIFINSSPTNGKKTTEEGEIADHPGDQYYGDVHYYTYDRDGFDIGIYPIPRFASEYGFQSLPAVESLLTVTDNDSDINLDSEFLKHRQHHPKGNSPLEDMAKMQLNPLNKDSPNYARNLVYVSQIIQAMAVKTESEYYSSYRNRLNNDNNGMTMGALYWQLNDVWVAPTWASIDYLGNWKMLHYMIKKSFAPIASFGFAKDDNLEIYVVADTPATSNVFTISVEIYKWNTLKSLNNTQIAKTFDPNEALNVLSTKASEYLSQIEECGSVEESRKNCFIYLTVADENSTIVQDNFVLPEKLNQLNLEKPTLEFTIAESNEQNVFEINVKTDKVALFVWLDTHGIKGKFSDNGFVQVDEIKTVLFMAEEETTANLLSEAITVISLLDVDFEEA